MLCVHACVFLRVFLGIWVYVCVRVVCVSVPCAYVGWCIGLYARFLSVYTIYCVYFCVLVILRVPPVCISKGLCVSVCRPVHVCFLCACVVLGLCV